MKSRFSRAALLLVVTVVLASPSFAAPPKQKTRDGSLLQKIVTAIKKPFAPRPFDDIVWPKP